MKRTAKHLFAACLAILAAASESGVATAAESGVAMQDLVKPMTLGNVDAVLWTRLEDSYTLRVIVPPLINNTVACMRGDSPALGSRTPRSSSDERQVPPAQPQDRIGSITGEEMRQLGIVDVADALRSLAQQNAYMPRMVVSGSTTTVARTPKVVQAWLLRADGTQILPVEYSDDRSRGRSCTALRARDDARPRQYRFNDEITYRFSLAESAQAVAVAFRIDDDYYVEKLQPLEFRRPAD